MNYSQSYEKFVSGAIDTKYVPPRDEFKQPEITTLTMAPDNDLFNMLEFERSNNDTNVYHCSYAVIRAKNNIYYRKQEVSSVYIITSGNAKTASTQNDSEVVDDIFLPGEILGLEDTGRHVYRKSAVAISDLLVLKVSCANLIKLSNTYPILQKFLLEKLSERIFRNSLFRKILAKESDEIKLLMFLYNIATRIGTCAHPATAFDLPLKRQDIATYLATEPTKLNCVFRRLHDEGIVKTEANAVKIHHILRLQEIWNSFSL